MNHYKGEDFNSWFDVSMLLQTWGSQILGPASFIIPLAVALSTFGAANGSCFSGCRSVMGVEGMKGWGWG